MTLEINEPKILCSKQKYVFDEIHIITTPESGKIAVVSFILKDENNSRVGTHVIRYENEEFNQFWSQFTTGTYLYSCLINKLGGKEENVALSESEKEFENKSSE